MGWAVDEQDAGCNVLEMRGNWRENILGLAVNVYRPIPKSQG
jgi:hypothetical protein